jgi:hypothetical protein
MVFLAAGFTYNLSRPPAYEDQISPPTPAEEPCSTETAPVRQKADADDPLNDIAAV